MSVSAPLRLGFCTKCQPMRAAGPEPRSVSRLPSLTPAAGGGDEEEEEEGVRVREEGGFLSTPCPLFYGKQMSPDSFFSSSFFSLTHGPQPMAARGRADNIPRERERGRETEREGKMILNKVYVPVDDKSWTLFTFSIAFIFFYLFFLFLCDAALNEQKQSEESLAGGRVVVVMEERGSARL